MYPPPDTSRRAPKKPGSVSWLGPFGDLRDLVRHLAGEVRGDVLRPQPPRRCQVRPHRILSARFQFHRKKAAVDRLGVMVQIMHAWIGSNITAYICFPGSGHDEVGLRSVADDGEARLLAKMSDDCFTQRRSAGLI